jgi:hypothetical protein
MPGQLTALQARALTALAVTGAQWTLTGGGALAGFYTKHRTTHDLDLFWHGVRDFTGQPDECVRLLEAAGLEVTVLQRTPSFVRLRAGAGADVVVVDLVAEPVPTVEAARVVDLDGTAIRVDSPHEILVNKLGALLHRAEIRDLIDLRVLLANGGNLSRALGDAAKKDGGFSPLVVGHLLHGFPIERQTKLAGLGATEVADLARFATELAERIAKLSQP